MEEVMSKKEFHKDDNGNYLFGEDGRLIPIDVCICAARCPSECCCGAWDEEVGDENTY
jgi:hypothetical protein